MNCACLFLDVPNSGRGVKDETYPKGYPPKIINGERQLFDKIFCSYVKKLGESKPTIVTGDLNVAHEEIGNYLIFF